MKAQARAKAKKIVEQIIKDIYGRSGGDHWFESGNNDVLNEIRKSWESIVYVELVKQ